MIILIRSNGINLDPRVSKYIQYYTRNNIDYKIIGWDRLGEKLNRKDVIFFKKKINYNAGGFVALFGRMFWVIFVIKSLFVLRKEITIIHACDLDATFPSLCFKKIFRHRARIIFDVFDWFSDTLYNQKTVILKLMKAIENICVKNVDNIIICEPERIHQIPFDIDNKYCVFQNIPSFIDGDTDFLIKDSKYFFDNEKLTLSYVGGFYADRLLEELLTIAERNICNLLFAGYGDKKIEDKCKMLIKSGSTNIRFYGKVDYKIGLNIMYNSDIIYAMYSKKNPNHIYAAPNKYYEALFLGKPIISTNGIILANKIVSNNVGYVVDESINDIVELIENVDLCEMKTKGFNAKTLWGNQFNGATLHFFENTYSRIINA